jgi:hypothetical protein
MVTAILTQYQFIIPALVVIIAALLLLAGAPLPIKEPIRQAQLRFMMQDLLLVQQVSVVGNI